MIRSRHHRLLFVAMSLGLTIVIPAKCIAAQTGSILDAEVEAFDCTNLSVSAAISKLASANGGPINVIIDSVAEPTVTVAARQQRVAQILGEILRAIPDYEFSPKLQSVLVCPRGLSKNSSFVLNQVIPGFQVEFWRYESGRAPTYGCGFDYQPASQLNIALPFLPLATSKPNCDAFPCVRHYKNRALIDVLTELSIELRRSWACGRVNPSFVRRHNAKAERDRKKDGLSRPYWPNEKLPAYLVTWSGKGAFHGDAEERIRSSP
jgi:hypothetical protein